MATRSTSRRRSIEDLRRAELVSAALRTISAQGFDRTTIRHIARAAGASTGSVHYYFETKEDLLLAAVAESDARFRVRVRTEIGALPSATEKFERLAELCFNDHSGDGPDWNVFIDFWQQAARHPEFRTIFEAANSDWLDLVVEIFELGSEAGEIVLEQPVRDEAMAFAAMLDGLALHSRVTDHVSPETACRIVAQYIDRLATRGPATATRDRRGRRKS